jgi:hypothetical protein
MPAGAMSIEIVRRYCQRKISQLESVGLVKKDAERTQIVIANSLNSSPSRPKLSLPVARK